MLYRSMVNSKLKSVIVITQISVCCNAQHSLFVASIPFPPPVFPLRRGIPSSKLDLDIELVWRRITTDRINYLGGLWPDFTAAIARVATLVMPPSPPL